MPRAFDGTEVPAKLGRMPCGGTPIFDVESGYSYRCDQCFATIGSVGMPAHCKTALKEKENEARSNICSSNNEQKGSC